MITKKCKVIYGDKFNGDLKNVYLDWISRSPAATNAFLMAKLGFLIIVIRGQNIFDPRVYNFYFYLNTNPDLIEAGINTPSQAESHWKNNGINEGRQACGSFHVLQYLDNYPDLKQKYSTNHTGAIDYYLSTGYAQKQLGYIPSGGYNRFTISDLDNNIWLSGSTRMAGAIDSIVLNGIEYINCWDHGRELQMAVTTSYGECYNPTEAGGKNDSQKTTTSSIIEVLQINDNKTLVTSNLPAFWMPPGSSESGCGNAVNTQVVSGYQMNKTVSIGYNGISKVIHYQGKVLIPEDVSGTQIESPTAYLNGNFNTFYSFNPENNNLTEIDINDNTGGHVGETIPVIIATNDGSSAIGVLPNFRPQRGFALFNFVGLGPESDGTSKWSVVSYFQNVSKGTIFSFENFLCIGSISEVSNCIQQIHKMLA